VNDPCIRRTVIQIVAAQIGEIRLDIAGANHGKLRLGLVLTVVTVAVTASGWPPVDAVQKVLYLVLVALPSTGVGVGLFVDGLMQARAERVGQRRADDREVDALRARILAEAGAGGPEDRSVDRPAYASPGPDAVPQATPAGRRPLAGRRRRLIGGRGAAAPFRAGFLGLR